MCVWEYSADGTFSYNSTGVFIYPTEEYWFVNMKNERLGFITRVEQFAEDKHFATIGLQWARDYYWYAYATVALYLFLIWAVPKYLANRKPFDLEVPLKYWNLFLAIFSFIGAVRVIPHMALVIWRHGFSAGLCAPPSFTVGHGTVGFWMVCFVYSKFFELFDTAFIVLRKRNLSFLHWYHHATVLLYTWDAFTREQGAGCFYGGMNYGVHAVMYFYYYLVGVKSKPLKWGVVVTILQILQMIIGVGLTIYGLLLSHSNVSPDFWTFEDAVTAGGEHGRCFVDRTSLFQACLMYSTYFYLFAEFFAKRYLFTPKKAAAKSA